MTLHTTGFTVDVWPDVVDNGDGARCVPAGVHSHCSHPPQQIDDAFMVDHTYTAAGDYRSLRTTANAASRATRR